MGINEKRKRNFIHNGTKYFWNISFDDYSNLSIIAEDKSVIIKYYFNQGSKKDSQTIIIEKSPKLESSCYHFLLQIDQVITPSAVKKILDWHDHTDSVDAVKYKYSYPHKNVLTELDFRGGVISFLNANEDALHFLNDIVGNTLIEASYPNRVKLFVSWNGAKDGFVIMAISDELRNEPFKISKTNFTGEILKNTIQNVIDCICEDQTDYSK